MSLSEFAGTQRAATNLLISHFFKLLFIINIKNKKNDEDAKSGSYRKSSAPLRALREVFLLFFPLPYHSEVNRFGELR